MHTERLTLATWELLRKEAVSLYCRRLAGESSAPLSLLTEDSLASLPLFPSALPGRTEYKVSIYYCSEGLDLDFGTAI